MSYIVSLCVPVVYILFPVRISCCPENREQQTCCLHCLVVLQFLDVSRLTDRKSLFESAWRLIQDLKEEAMMFVFDKTFSKDFIEVKWVQEIAHTKTFTWFRITSNNFCIKVLILVNACFIILWDWPSYSSAGSSRFSFSTTLCCWDWNK